MVDGLNTIDKWFLRKKMCTIVSPEVSEHGSHGFSFNDIWQGSEFCIRICARLSSDTSQISGVESKGKHAKREAAAK